MAMTKIARRSFAAGEITPEMFGRTDNVKNQTGLGLCRNAIVLPHGPVSKRSGTAFVNGSLNPTVNVRLIPFVFSASQSMVLEFGHGYIAFHTNGGSLTEAAKACTVAGSVVTCAAHGYVVGDRVFVGSRPVVVNAVADVNHFTGTDVLTGALVGDYLGATSCARVYFIGSPYNYFDLFQLKYTQDSDVLTISHPSYPTMELRRLGATTWTLSAPGLSSTLPTPPVLNITATAGTGTAYPKLANYKITSVSADGSVESLPTGYVQASNDLTLVGAKNVLDWTTAGAGLTYRIYKAPNDPERLYGFIGETTGLLFTDDNIIPDYSINPPSDVLDLVSGGRYPGAVAYFEQRRVFGGSTLDSTAVQMSRSGTESNFTISKPSQSGDAVSFRLKAQQQNPIRHLIPQGDLLALTASGVWRIFSNADGAILPSTVAARLQSSDGSNHVTPLVTGTAVLYVETSGKRVRDIGYSNESRGYVTTDRAILAPHLFNDYTVTDSAFQRNPDKTAWFVRSDGALLSLTYLPEQQVYAWAQHFTDGFVESVCCVPENNQDVLYLLVRRTLEGVTSRTIERMAQRQFATLGSAFFVDCGATYSGAPVSTVSGLWWLAGKSVSVLADGAAYRNLTVSATGVLTLDVPASVITVGLAFTTDIQTIPVSVDTAAASGGGTVKSIGEVSLLVNRTGVFSVGPDTDNLTDVPYRTTEPYDSAPSLKSEEVNLVIDGSWDRAGQTWIRSQDPVPFTLSALIAEVHLAG